MFVRSFVSYFREHLTLDNVNVFTRVFVDHVGGYKSADSVRACGPELLYGTFVDLARCTRDAQAGDRDARKFLVHVDSE